MIRFAMILSCLLLPELVDSAAADDLAIQPGQWKVTSNTRTFGPVSGTVNSTCEPAEYQTTGTELKWRLQCRGQLDLDVSGDFNFDSPSHYTATVSSKGRMAGVLMSDVKTELEGERVSECPQ